MLQKTRVHLFLMTVSFCQVSIRKLALCAGYGSKSESDAISQKFITSDQEALSPGRWENVSFFSSTAVECTKNKLSAYIVFYFIVMRPPTIYSYHGALLWNHCYQLLLEKSISRWIKCLREGNLCPPTCGLYLWSPAEKRYWWASFVHVFFSQRAPSDNSREHAEARQLLLSAFKCQLFL